MDVKLQPIYTTFNCNFAYQLRWGVTVFWADAPNGSEWLPKLSALLESSDKIRVISHRWPSALTLQFALSTPPELAPVFIVQRLKGRLRYLLSSDDRLLTLPSYSIRSYGTQNREVVEGYVASQWTHHRGCYSKAITEIDPTSSGLCWEDATVDLSTKQSTHQGSYWYCLHLVLVHVERWCDHDVNRLQAVQHMVRRVARKYGWRLSRCSILADHLHLSIGCSIGDKPHEVALAFMNNLAFVYGMKAIYKYSAYLGTFGEYDQRCVGR